MSKIIHGSKMIEGKTSGDNSNFQPTKIQTSDYDNNNPLQILKVRFAKGEISKEEYEEMRKMIES